MTDKYDRQLNQIYSLYEQKIDRDLNRPLTKRFTTKLILILVCLNLITVATLVVREITRPHLIEQASLTLDDVCKRDLRADINLRITYNNNCHVIPFNLDTYTALIDGDIDRYSTEGYLVVRRLSEQPISQVPVLYKLYLDAYDLENNYLGTRQHNQVVPF